MTLAGDWRHLLAGCDLDQHAAIVSPAAPLLVVAGAGSGKTRVLTRRIAWRIVEELANPAHVLALTFTRKAAAELRTRLGSLGLPTTVTAGTFHAVALAELRRHELEQGRRAPVLLERKAELLAEVVPDARGGRPGSRRPTSRAAGTERWRPQTRREVLRTVAGEIEWAAARLVTSDGYPKAATAAGRNVPIDLEAVAEAYRRYQIEKRRRGVLDFDDLLARLTGALDTDPDLAAAQRWRYRHLFVDELQDATPAQLRLLDAWLGGRSDLFAVGDPRQAIYGWNGAEPAVVEQFTSRYPGATVLHLDTNYRSTPQVVAVAASTLETAQRSAIPRASRPDGGAPTLRSYPDEQAEAEAVARILRVARHPGRRWADCAVLARTNAQLLVLEGALRTAGIPARATSGAGFLTSPPVRSALAGLDMPGGFSAWLVDLEQETAATFCLPEGGTSILEGPTLEKAYELAELVRIAREYAGLDDRPSKEGFLSWARSALRSDSAPSSVDAVELTTFHRAKGLEWRVVCVTGLEYGLVPIFQARSKDALDEERRLLYVALTRAVDELHCSWATVRHFGEVASNRQPSPYLGAIQAVITDLERLAKPDPAAARATFATTRAMLDASRAAATTPASNHPRRGRGPRSD